MEASSASEEESFYGKCFGYKVQSLLHVLSCHTLIFQKKNHMLRIALIFVNGFEYMIP